MLKFNVTCMVEGPTERTEDVNALMKLSQCMTDVLLQGLPYYKTLQERTRVAHVQEVPSYFANGMRFVVRRKRIEPSSSGRGKAPSQWV